MPVFCWHGYAVTDRGLDLSNSKDLAVSQTEETTSNRIDETNSQLRITTVLSLGAKAKAAEQSQMRPRQVAIGSGPCLSPHSEAPITG
jgi:hypothetical protein